MRQAGCVKKPYFSTLARPPLQQLQRGARDAWVALLAPDFQPLPDYADQGELIPGLVLF